MRFQYCQKGSPLWEVITNLKIDINIATLTLNIHGFMSSYLNYSVKEKNKPFSKN